VVGKEASEELSFSVFPNPVPRGNDAERNSSVGKQNVGKLTARKARERLSTKNFSLTRERDELNR